MAGDAEEQTARSNTRPVEGGIETDLRGLDYAGYLKLDELLGAQVPVSDHHDEMLFIIQHQTTELWIKLVIHELRSAMALLAADDLGPALKRLARVKHIQRQMTDQWSVLATLTPSEYAQFRGQPRACLGIPVRAVPAAGVPAGQQERRHDLGSVQPPPSRRWSFSTRRCGRPASTTSSCATCPDTGTPSRPTSSTVTSPGAHVLDAGLVGVFTAIYERPDRWWEVYEACEELVDIEDTFQTWRFRHLKTVERIIGFKRGTGGSSGVGFLKQALST